MAAFSTLQEIAIELVGGSSGAVALGVIDSEWVKTNEFLRLLVLSDHSTARLICAIRGYGPRKQFLTGTQAGITSGSQVNVSSGPIETLTMVVTGGRLVGTHPAAPPRGGDITAQKAELIIENRNVTANPEIPPHCILDADTVFHNGVGVILGGASVASATATYPVIPAINFAATVTICPDEFAEPITFDALSMKLLQDGQKVDAANLAGQRAEKLRALGVQGG